MAWDTDQWRAILQRCGVREFVTAKWAPVLSATIHDDTFSAGPDEVQAFLPEILHESRMLEAMVEDLNYSPGRILQMADMSPAGSRWRSLKPRAIQLARNPRGLAEAVYGGRMGNRPEGSGDGWTYIGRSPIGITGLDNYSRMSDIMGQDYVGIPHLLEQPHFALEATIGWWEDRVPDSILGERVLLRKRVNGGKHGLEHTQQLAALVQRAIRELDA